MLSEKQTWKKIGNMFYEKAEKNGSVSLPLPIHFKQTDNNFPFICNIILNLYETGQITWKLCDKMRGTVMLDVNLHSSCNLGYFRVSHYGEWNILRADYCYLMLYAPIT